MSESVISAIIEGGRATPGPPLGPAMGPLGINIGQVIAELNSQTAAFAGIKVPVKIYVDKATKKYRYEIGSPATGEMVKKEMGIEKGKKGGPDDPKTVGDMTLDKVIKVAKAKSGASLTKSLKAGVSEVLGTCLSMGATVDGRDPRAVRKDLKAGKFDSLLGS